MVQLRTLSGNHPGAVQVIQRFPCLIGRDGSAGLRLEEPGVWDRHLELRFNSAEGFTAVVLPGAIATLNGAKFESNLLRSGDILQLGAAKIQFWFAPTRQQSLAWRERLTWVALGGLCATQIALVYYLVR